MNLSTLIVGMAVLLVVLLAVRSLRNDKKNGRCGGCGGNCGGCWDAIELQIRVFHTKQYDMRLKVILIVSGINLVELDRVSA